MRCKYKTGVFGLDPCMVHYNSRTYEFAQIITNLFKTKKIQRE